jgi:hypothetical protein
MIERNVVEEGDGDVGDPPHAGAASVIETVKKNARRLCVAVT